MELHLLTGAMHVAGGPEATNAVALCRKDCGAAIWQDDQSAEALRALVHLRTVAMTGAVPELAGGPERRGSPRVPRVRPAAEHQVVAQRRRLHRLQRLPGLHLHALAGAG